MSKKTTLQARVQQLEQKLMTMDAPPPRGPPVRPVRPVTIKLPDELLGRIDADLAPKESRSAWARDAFEAKLKRRTR